MCRNTGPTSSGENAAKPSASQVRRQRRRYRAEAGDPGERCQQLEDEVEVALVDRRRDDERGHRTGRVLDEEVAVRRLPVHDVAAEVGVEVDVAELRAADEAAALDEHEQREEGDGSEQRRPAVAGEARGPGVHFRSLFDSMSNHMANSVNCAPKISRIASSTPVAAVIPSPSERSTISAMPRPTPATVITMPKR